MKASIPNSVSNNRLFSQLLIAQTGEQLALARLQNLEDQFQQLVDEVAGYKAALSAGRRERDSLKNRLNMALGEISRWQSRAVELETAG